MGIINVGFYIIFIVLAVIIFIGSIVSSIVLFVKKMKTRSNYDSIYKTTKNIAQSVKETLLNSNQSETEKMQCQYCGTYIDVNLSACPSCGAKVSNHK